MAVDIRIFNRSSGGDGSPGSGNPGNLALNCAPLAKGANNGIPKLFGYDSDSNKWALLNPPGVAPTIGPINLPGGTPGSSSGIGSAWDTFGGTKPTDPIIIATYGGTAYIKTGAGDQDAHWTAMGNATSFATAAEIATGHEGAKAIAPDQLRAYALEAPPATPSDGHNHLVLLDTDGQIAPGFIPNADAAETYAGTIDNKFLTPADLRSVTKVKPTGSGGAASTADHDYLVRLDASGHINSGFISFTGLTYRGNVDVTDAYSSSSSKLAGLKSGDFATVSIKGTANSSWPGFSGTELVEVGDMVLFEGMNWHLVSHAIDTSAYVNRSGDNTLKNDMAMLWDAPTSLKTIINGGSATLSKIDQVLLDCGTF